MRNISRNRFLGCFRPVVDMDLMSESETFAADRVQSKEDIMNKENSTVISYPAKKTFSQVIKATVFHIILAKSVRGRKVIDHSAKHNFGLNRVFVGREKQITVSNPNPVSSISSSSSSQTSTRESKGERLKSNQFCSCNNEESSSSDCVIFLLLVTLAVMIFFGKLFAVLFTSIWLYFLPRCLKPATSVIGTLKKKGNCKKKVIMEGLLERKPQPTYLN